MAEVVPDHISTEENRKTKVLVVTIFAIALMAGVVAVAAAQGQTPEERLKSLMAQLQQVTAQELANGQTIKTDRGVFFTGESAAKVNRVYQEAAQAYDATIARTASARQAAIANIRAFTGKPNLTVEYKSTAKSAYDSNVLIENYTVGTDYYQVDTRTNQVVQFGPLPLPPGVQPKQYDTTLRYTPAELETMARQFIAERAGVDLSKLIPNHGNKDGINYFFRWEDRTRTVDGMHPFIQVGFTRGGELLSYTNSLGM